MNKWLSLALVAYFVGALVEGISAASQLFRSTPQLTQESKEQSSESTHTPVERWQVFSAIATVSICGAFFWPCRLIHRSLKEAQQHQND